MKKRGQSAAFMARIRAMRNKPKKQATRRLYTMAKKGRRKRSYGSKAGMSGIVQTGLGVGAYILFESLIEPKLIQMANISNPLLINAGELLMGMYLARKGGILGNVGKAAIILNLYQIMQPYLSGVGGSSNGLSIFS